MVTVWLYIDLGSNWETKLFIFSLISGGSIFPLTVNKPFLPSFLLFFLHVCSGTNQSLSIQVTWSLSANQRPVSWSHDYCQPIRDQYPGHIITFVQSEASILVTWSWSLSTNQRLVSMSNDHSQLSRGKYPGHMISLNQSEASIQVTLSLLTNQKPVSLSHDHDHSQPIRG